MMEIDRTSYIFGSFVRRRQSQEIISSRHRSNDTANISHDRSKSTPYSSTTTTTATSITTTQQLEQQQQQQQQPQQPQQIQSSSQSLLSKEPKNDGPVVHVDDSKFKCPKCKLNFIEPRVLPCLHTFCLKCLEELLNSDCNSHWQEAETDCHANDKTNSRFSTTKRICCPICGLKTEVPFGGVSFYPPNYLLQHRMVLATLNAKNTQLLCDLCTTDILATSRCMDCAISLCINCVEMHIEQNILAKHDILALEDARKKGITKINRQIMCLIHLNEELNFFCKKCYQVVCRECVSVFHKGHICEPVNKAVKSHLNSLRIAAEKAKYMAEQSAKTANRLNATSKKIDSQCNTILGEVELFIQNYLKAIEEHRNNLREQIEQTRNIKLKELNKQKNILHRKVREARDIAFFVEELLTDGNDVEIMSFLKPVLNKIDFCNNLIKEKDLYLSESLQFLPEEAVPYPQSEFPLFGVITSQTVCPSNCILYIDGLQNLRVGRKTEVTLETKDRNNLKLERGGEQVSAEIRYRDAGISHFVTVDVEDKRDGTYVISFALDVAGKLVLSVNVKGQPIKDNPFPFIVKTIKPHQGTFHCCSFCSSGGSKEASCGCGGRMPGGYKGCGHGHEGHPGRRHWSCCGNIIEHSECNRLNNSLYQFTL